MTGEKVVLDDENLAIIKRIQSGKYPTGENQFQVLNLFCVSVKLYELIICVLLYFIG